MNIARFALISMCLAASAPVTAQVSIRMQPLTVFEGGCWSGRLTTGEVDQHCFNWVQSGNFLRDRHRVFRGERIRLETESTYYWEPESGNLRYLWLTSGGGVGGGVVIIEGNTYRFPETTFRSEGENRTIRSTYVFNGSDSYDSIVEERRNDQWHELWRVRMERSGR